MEQGSIIWLLIFCIASQRMSAFGLQLADWQGNGDKMMFLHIHMPKTGGQLFMSEFPKRYRTLIKRCPIRPTYGVPFETAIEKAKPFNDCNFISFEQGLWMADFVPKDRDVKALAMFRNPIELRISGLEHFRRKRGIDPSLVINRVASGQPHDYMDGYQMTDFQAKQLACGRDESFHHHYDRNCTPTVQEAAAKLESLWWVGIAEYYRESLCVLSYQMGAFNKEQCTCIASLAKRARPPLAHEGTEAAAASYTLSQLHIIAEVNRLDLMLYGMAVTRLFEDAAAVQTATGVAIFC